MLYPPECKAADFHLALLILNKTFATETF